MRRPTHIVDISTNILQFGVTVELISVFLLQFEENAEKSL